MRKENDQQGSRTPDMVNALEESLKNPLKRSKATELFTSLIPGVVSGISKRDPFATSSVLRLLGKRDMLGIEEKDVDVSSNPVYLQGRLDTLLDVAKAASGLFILQEARRRTPKDFFFWVKTSFFGVNHPRSGIARTPTSAKGKSGGD